ncbi:MAG: putative repeat protein (TIGR03806 family) [Cyclobacteriaceae bacterium]|jgi:uncharacterized repeat protein (TIGR03806 family)
MKWHFLILVLIFIACQPKKGKKPNMLEEVRLEGSTSTSDPQKLSDWKLFQEPMKDLKPMTNILRYDLNTPLFSDYSHKSRFVKIPKGESAIYQTTEVFDFPLETVLIKNFYYPADFRAPKGNRRIIETRLLINESEEWKALTYVWNEAQTEAFLEIAGRSIPVSWKDENGVLKNVNYSVPNLVQCKSCHEFNGKLMPIGPTARQLNRQMDYTDESINQLKKWESEGLISSLPPVSEWSVIPVWNDPKTGSLNDRARAWLDINCAHCHRAEGPAKNTGLYLTYDETDLYKVGINKPPVAAGRGSGGLKYSIVKGDPDKSILLHRISSLDPGVMMPEVGRKMNHEEGIALIREWISQL